MITMSLSTDRQRLISVLKQKPKETQLTDAKVVQMRFANQ